MAILTRARYKHQGYLFHPEFFSMFSDNWFSECAFRDGVVIDARDRITFEHLHPAFGKGEIDATYERSNAPINYTFGKGVFDRLKAGIKVSADMEGWFDFRDVYDHLAQVIPDTGRVVEVGSWVGKSAIYIRDRMDDLGKTCAKMICVDTFKGDSGTGEIDVFDDFVSNVQGRAIDCHPLPSIIAATHYEDESLDAVFIDAAHDYESIKADIDAWLPKVKPGGFFGGHDIEIDGVFRAVEESGFQWYKVGRCWIKSDFKP